MSFRCGFCGIAQPPRTKPKKVTIHIKEGQGKTRVSEDGMSAEYIPTYNIAKEVDACLFCGLIPRKPELVSTAQK